ncbi:MAG: outer membrane protein assembly factor BamD [Treponema sp.]|jgi:hypothetical protein|nr:outer membrane protein assembly factor BamD [Treponema sp.]
MKHVLWVIIFLALVSCASKPAVPEESEPQAESAQGMNGAGENQDISLPQAPQTVPEETPELDVFLQAPDETLMVELAEPGIDLPETDSAVSPPEERITISILPEPESILLLPEFLLPDTSALAGESVPLPEPSVESTPSVVIPPPAFLGPAEEYLPRPPIPPRSPILPPESIPSRPPISQAPESVPPSMPSPPVIVNEPVPQRVSPDEEIIFSRTVRATVGQLVEIPFRGNGWVFLGEQGARRGIVFDSRRYDPEGQSFIFKTEAAGTYALKFYRQDFVQNFILNDYVQVIVGEAPETAGTGWFNPAIDRGRVIAEPRWLRSFEQAQPISPQPVSPQPVSPETAVSDEGVVPVRPPASITVPSESIPAPAVIAEETVTPSTTINAPPSAPSAGINTPPAAPSAGVQPAPEEILKKAREEFDAGRIAQAISQIDQYREIYPSGSDEAWWLYGQFYEANSPSRDILKALDYYRRLVREYPQSRYYNDARRRIAYLERYFINIQ